MSAEGYYNQGKAYQDAKDYDRAIASYDQAIRLDPKFVYPYKNRGRAHQEKGDYEHAITDYDRAVQLDLETVSAKK